MNSKKGITVAETMLSAMIISLVIGGVLLIFVHTVGMSKRINFIYAATNIAKSRIERAMSTVETGGFAALTDGNFGESHTRLDSDGAPDPNGNFRRSTTITTSYDANARLTRVYVEVEYRYRGEWETDSPVWMDTLFPDIS